MKGQVCTEECYVLNSVWMFLHHLNLQTQYDHKHTTLR